MSSAPENPAAVQVASVSCNHCGAPLHLPADTRFATCSYCGARLEVLHQGGAAYTRVLDDIDQRTRRIEASVDELNHREQLDQLDREWMLARDRYMIRDKNGNMSLPTGGPSAPPQFSRASAHHLILLSDLGVSAVNNPGY
jgi:transcription elongation factor Elf1